MQKHILLGQFDKIYLLLYEELLRMNGDLLLVLLNVMRACSILPKYADNN